VRVIAATNRDLEAAIRAGTFRKDLFFRLNVVAVHLPPLRERLSDIPMLVDSLLERHAPGENVQLTAAAMKLLMRYDWPGNVRELENCINRALTLGDRRQIDVNDLPPALTASNGPDSTAASHEWNADHEDATAATGLDQLERLTIQRVFEQVGGDITLASKMLGISRATVYRKLKRYQISLHPAEAKMLN